MHKILKAAIAGLALAAVLGWMPQSSAKDVIKSINDYRTKASADARASGKAPDFNAITLEVKRMAEEAIKDIDPKKVDAKEAFDWAQVFSMAGKHKEVCDLARKYLTSEPTEQQKFDAQMMMMQSCNELGEGDMIAMTMMDVMPPTPQASANLTSMTVYYFADTIAKTEGVAKAIEVLNGIEQKMKFDDPKEFAKRQLQTVRANEARTGAKPRGTDEELLKAYETSAISRNASMTFSITQKKADLLIHSGKKAEGIKLLDDFLAGREKTDPVYRQASAIKTQYTLPGMPAPAITVERGYGDFPGLEAWKGKVVILDFFAHWCGPCIASFNDMKQMYSDLRSQGLEFVHITTYYGYYKQDRELDQDTEFARMGDFIKDYDLPWPVVYGPRTNFDAYGITGIPHVAVLDRKGNVRKIKVGYSPASFAEFRKEVEAMLAEKG